MASEGAYVCTLDKPSIKKAEKELSESAKERDGAIESFRQWIQQNNRWLKSPTNAKFLLGFLRNAKFIQLAARKRLVNFLAVRAETPEWFGNMDTTNEKIVECIRTGFFIVLPNRDKEGRTIMMGRPGYMDISGRHSMAEYMLAAAAMIDYLLMDENVQVNGVLILEDMTNMSMKHQNFFGLENLKKSMNVWMKAYPVRYRGLHYFNTNPVFEAMFVIIKPLLPDKLKSRLHIHGSNLTDLYKHIDMCLLPEEYLPDDYKGKCPGSVSQIVEKTINELQIPEIRGALLELSSAEYGVDKTLKPNDTELYTESFRKLNID